MFNVDILIQCAVWQSDQYRHYSGVDLERLYEHTLMSMHVFYVCCVESCSLRQQTTRVRKVFRIFDFA